MEAIIKMMRELISSLTLFEEHSGVSELTWKLDNCVAHDFLQKYNELVSGRIVAEFLLRINLNELHGRILSNEEYIEKYQYHDK